jgi:hypothetical protein
MGNNDRRQHEVTSSPRRDFGALARGTMTATHACHFGFDVHGAEKRYGGVRTITELSF